MQFFCRFSTDFVGWNVEKGKQGKHLLSSSRYEDLIAFLEIKKSQIDTEIDKNPKSFQIQRFSAIFPRNFRRTLWIGTLKRVNKERMYCPVGFFGDFLMQLFM